MFITDPYPDWLEATMAKALVRQSSQYGEARRLISELARITNGARKIEIAQQLINLGIASSFAQEDVFNEAVRARSVH